jgi:hypothetical protein
MHRIYFDANEATFEPGVCRYDLGLRSSVKDLAEIVDKHDGMRVIIYMPGELEMEATLEFDAKYGCWMARPIPGTTNHYY